MVLYMDNISTISISIIDPPWSPPRTEAPLGSGGSARAPASIVAALRQALRSPAAQKFLLRQWQKLRGRVHGPGLDDGNQKIKKWDILSIGIPGS